MPNQTPYDLRYVKFLIAERNPNMRGIMRQILRTFGAVEIRDAADGAQAFNFMPEFVPDIITTGWNMNPMSGIEFTKMVRRSSDSPCQMVPIIMVTAHSELAEVTKARDAGITEFLAKPLSAGGLYSRIVTCIERPRPFVRAPGYVGPCRKRRMDTDYTGPRRRASDREVLDGVAA
jgi:two-component system chemotaxis response regulator CheY